MEKTWKPTTAGILTIIAGALNLIAGIVVAALSGLVGWVLGSLPMWYPGFEAIDIAPNLAAIGIPLIILGIVAIIGGIYAIKRRVWGLALAGAICALFPPPVIVLGILSIIFVALGKKEFAQS